MSSADLADRDRAAILHNLSSPDEEMRRLAVERLLEFPMGECLPHLLNGLGDKSWRVRKAVVGRLVACGESEAVDQAHGHGPQVGAVEEVAALAA